MQSGRLTDQAVALGPLAGLDQKQCNLVTAYNCSLWYVDSDDQEDKVKFLAAAVACQKHHEDSSEKHPSDNCRKHCKAKFIVMPPPPRNEAMNHEADQSLRLPDHNGKLGI